MNVVALDEATVAVAPHVRRGPWTMTVSAGTFTAILGPNGAGKSTLLQALSGELALHAGQRTFAWAGPDDPATQAVYRALLPQQTPTRVPFTAAEVVALAVPASGHAVSSPPSVAAALARFGALPLAARAVDTLSGGEAKKVHLARVYAQLFAAPPRAEGPVRSRPPANLLGAASRETAGPVRERPSEPRLLLLDEPTAPLDPAAARATLATIAALPRDAAADGFAAAVVAVLHDVPLAARFADRIVLLGPDGACLADGPPKEALTAAAVRAAYGLDSAFVDDGRGEEIFVFLTPSSPNPSPLPLERSHHEPL